MRRDDVFDALLAAGLGNLRKKEKETEEMLREMSGEDWEELWRESSLHQVWGIVLAGMKNFPQADPPDKIRENFAEAEKQVALQYYSMLSFTTYVLELLQEESIPCYLLKGIALNTLYPSEDMRKLADADVYISDEENFHRADRVLQAAGFVREPNENGFHICYHRNVSGKMCLLELHWRPCDILPDASADREVVRIFSGMPYRPRICRIAGRDIPVLPPEENALQLVLHMFQHLIREGFGFRGLCDWCVFWRAVGSRTDGERFLSYLERTGMTGLAWAVTRICIDRLGLDGADVPWMESVDPDRYGDSAKLLYEDISAGGEFGRGERSRVVAFRKHTFAFLSYMETVHRMMQARFPRWKKIVVAWPVLWAATVLIFFRNNRSMRRGSAMDVIKSAKKRETLFEQMKVFEK